MSDTLTIAVCSFLVPEVARVIKLGGYPDVKLVSFPASCSANLANSEKIKKIIVNAEAANSDLIIISGSCYSPGSIQNNPKVKIVTLKQCFEILINNDTIFHFISNGYYIASNGWLKSVDQHIANWGFEKDLARSFFNESMKGILFLDTKIPGDYLPNLKVLSEYMDLPHEILPIGLTHCKMYIDSLVLNWRNENERKSQNRRISAVTKQSADYSVIFNQLETLVNLTDENKIIHVGFELINILFAPFQVKYTKYLNNLNEYFEFEGISKNQKVNLENSFSFEIYYANEILGEFLVEGIQFPNFINQYKVMGKIVGQIFGISIANARKYQVIREQKDRIEEYSIELQNTNNSKDKFFSIIAHDLKGPFNSLLGFSELLNEELKTGRMEKIELYGSIIHKTLNDTFNLLVNLLEWAQSQSNRITFNPHKIELFETVDEIIFLLSSQAAKKNISLEVDIAKNFEVCADRNMLKTIVRNLVSNAIKFTPENGKVTVSSNLVNNFALISIRDNGVGMELEDQKKLFLLETTESKQGTFGEKGTGLGLILCKEFVEKHNGKIWVESEIGKGSIFHFTIDFDSTKSKNKCGDKN